MKFKSNNFHIIFDVWYVNLFIFMYNTAVTNTWKKVQYRKVTLFSSKDKINFVINRSFLSFDVKWCNQFLLHFFHFKALCVYLKVNWDGCMKMNQNRICKIHISALKIGNDTVFFVIFILFFTWKTYCLFLVFLFVFLF